MPVTQPDSMLVTPHTVSPMVNPIIFTIGTTIRFPTWKKGRGRREEDREVEEEERGGTGGEGGERRKGIPNKTGTNSTTCA